MTPMRAMHSKRLTRRERWLACVFLVLVAAVVGHGVWDHLRSRRFVPPGRTFDGYSNDLSHTVIVPTLDTPIPQGKNVIWCAAFQLAWNRMAEDVVKGPITVAGAENLSERLYANRDNLGTPLADDYYAEAGPVAGGTLERIRQTLAARFPGAPVPQFDAFADGLVAYAYLRASVRFKIPFFENDEALRFRSADGGGTPVTSFGVRMQDLYGYDRLREQVQVLYRAYKEDALARDEPTLVEFAIDPCRHWTPYQIVLAAVMPRETLAATLSELDEKIAQSRASGSEQRLGGDDVLLVPNMAWRITHRFRELEGTDKHLLNPGFSHYWVQEASQVIQFNLDRSGAELAAEGRGIYGGIPCHFVFDRPFVVYMRQRAGGRPFLAMWVENAELLVKK